MTSFHKPFNQSSKSVADYLSQKAL